MSLIKAWAIILNCLTLFVVNDMSVMLPLEKYSVINKTVPLFLSGKLKKVLGNSKLKCFFKKK